MLNRLALASSISALYAANVWKKEWYLIESLYTADCGTIVISDTLGTPRYRRQIERGAWRCASG